MIKGGGIIGRLIGLVVILGFCVPVWAADETAVLRVGVRRLNYTPPLLDRLFAKSEDSGTIPELMRLLKPLLKTRIEYAVSSTHVERRILLKTGEIDVIAFDSPQLTTDPSLDFISVGLHINRQLFVHKSRRDIFSPADLINVRIAVIKGDNYMPHLNNALGSSLQIMGGPHQALQALNAGRVDAFLAPSSRTAENIINQERLEDVVKVGVRIEQIQMSLAVLKSNTALKRALSRAVADLRNTGKLKNIHERWYDVAYTPSPWRNIFKWVLIVTALIVFKTLLVVLTNRRLKSRVSEVTKDLRNSEERYRNLIHSSPDMVLVVDREGVIRHSNPVADQILGSPGEPMVGSELSGSVEPGQRPALGEFVDQTFSQGRGRREFRLVDDKGVIHEVDIAARVLSDREGGASGICCFARDVTQRNAIERELVQADRMATIGKMAAGVAHEINNPIGIVRANVELLLARNMYIPESREFLEAIQRNSIRAGQITQDLLAAARPKTPEMRRVNLEELIRLALGMLRGQLKDIEVLVEPAASPPMMMGDPNLLQQVLVNLFLNARSAMKDSPVKKLWIHFCSDSMDDALCLRIEDSGPGIEKELLNEIFEPFFTRGKKEGFGLGLFISRRIIEKHNGMMFAESDVGKGAQFIIELPVDGSRAGDDDNGAT